MRRDHGQLRTKLPDSSWFCQYSFFLGAPDDGGATRTRLRFSPYLIAPRGNMEVDLSWKGGKAVTARRVPGSRASSRSVQPGARHKICRIRRRLEVPLGPRREYAMIFPVGTPARGNRSERG